MESVYTTVEAPSTKVRLLDAAATVFLAQGFANATLDMVRQRAGVSNGSLYHHFPTKTHLADALYAHVLRDIHAFMLVRITPETDAEMGVKGLVRAYVQWVLNNPDHARLLHELRGSAALVGGPRERDETNAKAFQVLAQWVKDRTAAGQMREMPQSIWMALVFSPVRALMPGWVNEPKPSVSPKVRAALEHAAWMAVAT